MTKSNYSLLAVALCAATLAQPLQAEERSYFTTGCAALGALSIAATAYYARSARKKQLEELDGKHAKIVQENDSFSTGFKTTVESNAEFAQKPEVQALEEQRSSLSAFFVFAKNDFRAHLANAWSWVQSYWSNGDQTPPRDPAEVDCRKLNLDDQEGDSGQPEDPDSAEVNPELFPSLNTEPSAPVESPLPCLRCFTVNDMQALCSEHQ